MDNYLLSFELESLFKNQFLFRFVQITIALKKKPNDSSKIMNRNC